MKKFMSNLIAVAVMAMPLAAVQAYAVEDIPQIQVESVSAEPGESIDVAVELINNPGIIATSFTISYDPECLELTGVDDARLFADMTFTPGGDMTLIPFRLMWDSLATENYVDNGTMAVLHFNVLDTASAGLAEIEINVETENTFDVNLDEVAIESVSGGIEIKGEEVTTTDTSTTTSTTTTSTTKETTTTETTTTSTTEETTATETTISTTEETTTTETTISTTEETTETETTTSTTEETTATETTTSTTEEITIPTTTIITTTDTTNYFASVEEMCEMASKDYKEKNGTVPAKSEAVTNADGTVSILLKNKGGETLCIYTIDPVTGVGTDNSGKEVNLPQTGNNSLGVVATATAALALTVTGAVAVMKSGVIRKKNDNE